MATLEDFLKDPRLSVLSPERKRALAKEFYGIDLPLSEETSLPAETPLGRSLYEGTVGPEGVLSTEALGQGFGAAKGGKIGGTLGGIAGTLVRMPGVGRVVGTAIGSLVGGALGGGGGRGVEHLYDPTLRQQPLGQTAEDIGQAAERGAETEAYFGWPFRALGYGVRRMLPERLTPAFLKQPYAPASPITEEELGKTRAQFGLRATPPEITGSGTQIGQQRYLQSRSQAEDIFRRYQQGEKQDIQRVYQDLGGEFPQGTQMTPYQSGEMFQNAEYAISQEMRELYREKRAVFEKIFPTVTPVQAPHLDQFLKEQRELFAQKKMPSAEFQQQKIAGTLEPTLGAPEDPVAAMVKEYRLFAPGVTQPGEPTDRTLEGWLQLQTKLFDIEAAPSIPDSERDLALKMRRAIAQDIKESIGKNPQALAAYESMQRFYAQRVAPYFAKKAAPRILAERTAEDILPNALDPTDYKKSLLVKNMFSNDPEMWQNIRGAWWGRTFKNALVNDELSVKKLISSYEQMTPEFKQIMFDTPGEIQKADHLMAWLKRIDTVGILHDPQFIRGGEGEQLAKSALSSLLGWGGSGIVTRAASLAIPKKTALLFTTPSGIEAMTLGFERWLNNRPFLKAVAFATPRTLGTALSQPLTEQEDLPTEPVQLGEPQSHQLHPSPPSAIPEKTPLPPQKTKKAKGGPPLTPAPDDYVNRLLQ